MSVLLTDVTFPVTLARDVSFHKNGWQGGCGICVRSFENYLQKKKKRVQRKWWVHLINSEKANKEQSESKVQVF